MKEEKRFIPLSVPNFQGNEKAYVNDAVVSEWVSTGGSMVSEFEQCIADYVGMPRAVACNSGTSGLHLAMMMAGIGPGCEVLAPALTFIAAVNPIRYVGAQPIFLGCDDTLCLSPSIVREFLENNTEMKNGLCINKRTGAHIKALVVVHVFGNMADMHALMQICGQYNLLLIEDATEALGTRYTKGPYKDKMAGTIGDVGVYSFNGNKLITTGAGGMVVSNHADWLEEAKHLSTQAKADEQQFFHDEVGYNYRLTNVQAALGLAQMEQIEKFIEHKHKLYNIYQEDLDGKHGYRLLPFVDYARCNKWFFSLYLTDSAPLRRDELIAAMKAQGIQTRPVWALINEQADYPCNESFGLEKAQDYRARIVNIPCSTNLSYEDARAVAKVLLAL